jgi:hypothetical protein
MTLMGHSVAVRTTAFDAVRFGSNPNAPAKSANDNRRKRHWLVCWLSSLGALDDCGGIVEHNGINCYWRCTRCGKIVL